MSKLLALRFNESNQRMNSILNAMKLANPLSDDYVGLSEMARSELDTMQAINNSSLQQLCMSWTTAGDFSHLQSTPGVRF